MKYLVAGLVALSCLTVGSARLEGSSKREECGLCHPEQRVEHATGVHAAEGVDCAGCHGGDGSSRDADRAHRSSFRALTDRQEIPGACAECHSDLDRMRPYNLPIDQFALYTTSQHGKLVAAGDTRGAVCTDCHGVHEIKQVQDPQSPTHTRHLAGTCGACHGDADLMAEFGLSADIVSEYEAGVHGRAMAAGNLAAPSCTSCHGTHGSAPPGLSDVDKVCGACHQATRRAFIEGPHYEAMLEAELPECASCHDAHEVRSFGPEAVGSLCSECHSPDSDQAQLSSKLYALIEEAQDSLDRAGELVEQGERRAIEVEDYKSRIEEGRTLVTEALILVHAVTLEPVEELTSRAHALGEEVRHELYAKMDSRPARVGLVLFWFYVVLTVIVLTRLKKQRAGGRA